MRNEQGVMSKSAFADAEGQAELEPFNVQSFEEPTYLLLMLITHCDLKP
jgi:hypothetical protein